MLKVIYRAQKECFDSVITEDRDNTDNYISGKSVNYDKCLKGLENIMWLL